VPKAPQLLKMDATYRGQLSAREVGGGQGNAFGERSGPDDTLAGACAKGGTGSISLPSSWGIIGSFSSQSVWREKGRCCQLALARAGRALAAACRAPSTHSSGSSQRFKSLAFLAQKSGNNLNQYNSSKSSILRISVQFTSQITRASTAHDATLSAPEIFVVLHLLQQ